MTHILDVDHSAPAAMLLSAGRWLSRIGPAVCSTGDRQQRRNRPHHAGRAAGLIASRAHFRNQPYSSKVFVMPPTQVAVSDYSPAAPTFTRCPVCRVLCRPDRPEPAAGRALRADLSEPVLNPIQPRRLISGILVASLKERLGGRYPPWKGSASAMHGALLFARTGKTSSSVEKLWGGRIDAARRDLPVIHWPSPHIRVVSNPKSLIR